MTSGLRWTRLSGSTLEHKFNGGLNTAALELVNMSRAILLISNFIFVANSHVDTPPGFY